MRRIILYVKILISNSRFTIVLFLLVGSFVQSLAQEPAKAKNSLSLALKTNMLYDAALTPNIAVELSLNRKWSVEGEFNYAWWKFGSRHYHRIEMGGLEVRRRFSRNSDTPLTGWFAGAYVLAGNYDLMYSFIQEKSSREGTAAHRNSGRHHLTYATGLSVGYAYPLKKRLNLEFELGLGYLWGRYDTYRYDPEYRDYHYVETNNRKYIGPTKVKITLSWLIGNGHKNSTKK